MCRCGRHNKLANIANVFCTVEPKRYGIVEATSFVFTSVFKTNDTSLADQYPTVWIIKKINLNNNLDLRSCRKNVAK